LHREPTRRVLYPRRWVAGPSTHSGGARRADDHALEHVAGLGEIRRVPRVSLGVDIFQNDLAADLPVIRDEALRLVPRDRPMHKLGQR
jgi:hypothetical protein